MNDEICQAGISLQHSFQVCICNTRKTKEGGEMCFPRKLILHIKQLFSNQQLKNIFFFPGGKKWFGDAEGTLQYFVIL